MIKAKEKKCKGTGRANGHGCGEMNFRRTYGLGHKCKCYQKWLITSKEGKELVKKRTLKATASRRSFEKAEKEYKNRAKLPAKLNLARGAVHRAIRERDKGKPCISCGCPYHEGFHAGHLFKAELYSSIKFHFDNIHGQCPVCNIRKDGNVANYELNLPHRIGQRRFENLKYLALVDKRHQDKFKWDISELDEIIRKANKYYNEIKS